MEGILGGGAGYENFLSQNRYGVRNMESRFLQNEYEKMQQSKNREKAIQQAQKEQDGEMLKQLNQAYLNHVNQHRRQRVKDMQSLSVEYQNFISQKQQERQLSKRREKSIESSTLVAPTWIRDTLTERQSIKKNQQEYNKALEDHVLMRERRKQQQIEEEKRRQNKYDEEAKAMLQRQYEWLEARHRHKSEFEKRQNSILGVNEPEPPSGTTGIHSKEQVLRKKELGLYSQGLSIQLKKEEEKHQRKAEQATPAGPINTHYNPITNPIPYVYKNPNVLKMMTQS